MLKCFTFFSVFMMYTLSIIVPHVCPVLNIWFEYPELSLLFLVARICSLHLVWNVLPVCPTYFSGQSRHFVWQMPLFLFISIWMGFYYVLYCVLCSECYFYFCFFKDFCNSPCFFTSLCKGSPFCFSVLYIGVYILFIQDRAFPDLVFITFVVMHCVLWRLSPFTLLYLLLDRYVIYLIGS
jgi:hypothetical protein